MSRRTLALTVALALAPMAGLAEPLTPEVAAQDFAAANDRALEGDAAGAVGLYRSLLERGAVHPDLLYNLGTVLAAKGEPVKAAVALERALRLEPGHADARANLEALRARQQAGVTAAEAAGEAGSVALSEVLEPIVAAVPAAPVAWGAVLGQALLFLGWWLARRTLVAGRRRAWITMLVIGAALFTVCGAITAAHAWVSAEPLAVAREGVELRQGPDARFEPRGTVAAGARLHVRDDTGAWLQVLQTDGTSGWVRTQDVIRVD